METKQCTRCHQELSLEQFYRRVDYPKKLQAWCKGCLLRKNREWRGENPERLRLQAKQWRNNRKSNHPDEVILYHRDWRRRNKEKVAEWGRRWRAKHPEYHRRYNQQDYQELRQQMLNAYGGKCACCGEWRKPFLTLDHVYGNGSIHARLLGRGGQVYRDLRRRGWPKDGFRLLCMNCNFAVRFGDACPHTWNGDKLDGVARDPDAGGSHYSSAVQVVEDNVSQREADRVYPEPAWD